MDDTLRKEIQQQVNALNAMADACAAQGQLALSALLLGARQTIRVLVTRLEPDPAPMAPAPDPVLPQLVRSNDGE